MLHGIPQKRIHKHPVAILRVQGNWLGYVPRKTRVKCELRQHGTPAPYAEHCVWKGFIHRLDNLFPGPVTRNEWICWVTWVKRDDTRKDHVRRTVSELIEGMRRPCCWIGCIHRTDKAVSPSIQGILAKRNKGK